jgi:hypothetical protein
VKDLYNEDYKPLQKETEEDIKKKKKKERKPSHAYGLAETIL